MKREEIREIVAAQRKFFLCGATLEQDFRIRALKKLRQAILENEEAIHDAIYQDLGKSKSESYMCEVGLSLSELSYMLSHIRSFMREKRVHTPLAQFYSRSFTKPSPYGVVLIMSPWNYPFLLSIEPMIDAIAAGNTVVLKPSAYSPHTSAVIKRMLEECFDSRFVAVVTGGREENTGLLEEHFDYIFFTGSQSVGKVVMEQAAKHLTPVTLELGGKSPCIVDAFADIRLAAKRIVFGKFLNCGQTCVAPDYILCHRKVEELFIEEAKDQIKKQYRRKPLANKSYGKIINEKHFDRILGLIDEEKVVYGGRFDKEALKIEPTILRGVSWDDAVMSEEIFGPLMPVITYESLDEIIEKINTMAHPLALYLFSEKKEVQNKVMKSVSFGGGCINDTIIHLATSEMGFGGFGESGMGSYHGKAGFETFSHRKSIVDKKTWIDLPMRYQPYHRLSDKLVRMFLK